MRRTRLPSSAAIAVLLVVLALSLACGCSRRAPVSVSEAVTGPYTFAYRVHQGDYSETAATYAGLWKDLAQSGVTPVCSIGVYLDDPAKVPAAQRRAYCGAVIGEADLPKLEGLRGRFAFERIGRSTRLVAEFDPSVRDSREESERCDAALADFARRKGYTAFGQFVLYEAGRTRYVRSARELEYDYPPRSASASSTAAGP